MSFVFCRTLAFDDLLGTGVVHLLLGGVGGEHSVEGVGLALDGGEKCERNMVTTP